MTSAENKAVFLSYASQDAEAATRVVEALRAAGVEVWFDQNELVGGDAWDQKIRGQIKACALFVPLISAATQARREGYFRLEWKLAAQRTHMISERQAFLLPVVIDGTSDAAADVPEEFRAVQWTRLPSGEGAAVEKFCARVGTLLGGSDVARVSRPVGSEITGQETRATLRKPSRAWLVPGVAAGALLIAGVVYFALRPRSGGESATAAAVNSRAVASPARETGPRAEVAALMERVRALTRKTDVVRAELDGAVGLLEQAAKLDPADPEVWAAWALIDCRYATEWLDRSTARFDLAQRHATQAVGLDPKSPAARLAQATTMTLLTGDRATKMAAIAMLEPLVGEPGDRADALVLLANLKWDLGYADEASSYLDRAAKYPGRLGQVHYQRATRYLFSGQVQRSQDEIDRALAVEPAAKFQLWKSYLLMIWQGDVEGSRRVMREIPPAMLVEDFPASARYFVSLWARDYDGAVAAMRAVPRDYLESGALRGPTGYFKGYALARWGKPAAAETEWRAALDVVERRLGAQPNERGLLSLKALLLKSLGETSAAEKAWRTLRELYGASIESWEDHFARLEILPDEEAINYLAEGAKQSQPMTLAASLRLDPFVDRLRTNPRFVELLARIEADPRLSPKAKPGSASGAAALDPKSVAVLAFANMSADKDNEYFSDGLSGNILDKLGRVPGLRVIGQISSFSYKGKNVSAQQIGQELRAGTIVDGSVQKMGTRLRITARVINAADGTQVWSEPFDKDLTAADIFAMQDEIALKIAAKLAPGAAAAPAAGSTQPTQNLAAYEAYLRGRSVDARGFSQVKLLAIPYYQEAVRLDPDFALAWARLAYAWAWVYWGNGVVVGDELAKAQRALAAAVRLQPELPEVHLARAAIVKADGVNLAEAERELKLAESRQPANPDILYERALVARFSGRLAEALALAQRVNESDPYNANGFNTTGLILTFLGRYPEALKALEQSAKLGAGPVLNLNPYHNQALVILQAERDGAKAVKFFDEMPREQFDDFTHERLAQILGAAGRPADALAGIKLIKQPAFLTQWGYQVRSILAARAKEMMGDAEGARHDYAEGLLLAQANRDQHPQLWRAYPPVALASAALGKKDEALAAARMALKLVPPTENPYYAAHSLLPVLVEVLTRFEMVDEALAIVREQIAAGWWRRNQLLLFPEFFQARKDPRFRALAEKAPL